MDERDDRLVDDDPVGRVIALAGSRPAVPEDDAARITAAVREVWRREVRRRRVRVWGLSSAAALAASLVLALGVRFLFVSEIPAAQPIATVAAVSGEVLFRQEDGSWRPISADEILAEGAQVRTASGGRGGLLLEGGVSLRLDRATHVILEEADRLELAAGSVYLDSGAREGSDREKAAGLVVVTPFGSARDVGTQFLVRLEPDSMCVGVREGSVVVKHGDETHRAPAGVELRVDEEGTVERRALSPYGDEWSWILAVPSSFALEGATVESFLRWVASETGWTIRYADPALAARASEIVLHGSIEGLDPASAPAEVLATTRLSSRLESGVLVVE